MEKYGIYETVCGYSIGYRCLICVDKDKCLDGYRE